MQLRLLLFFLVTIVAQTTIWSQVKIKSITFGKQGKWLSYSFPFIIADDKKTADAINFHLQSAILENQEIITDPNTIFENSRYINNDSIHQSGHSMIDYAIVVNNRNILSLKFQMEGTGAYSEEYALYFSFDSRTGKLISPADIFTPQGLVQIKKMLVLKRQKLIAAWLEEMKELANKDSTFVEETFANCNSEAEENNCFIKATGILFYKEYCFPHVVRPYDTDLNIAIAYKEVRKYLTEKGRKLLIKRN